MQAFTRASATLSQVLAREQRILMTSMTSVSYKYLHKSAPAGSEAMPLPTVEKVLKSFMIKAVSLTILFYS